MKKIKKVLAAVDAENEFDVNEPEEVGNNSQDKWAPMAIAKTSGKRGRPAKSTPARKKKKPNVSDNADEKEIPPKKERGSKAKPRPPAPIPSSSRGRGKNAMKNIKKVLAAVESENEFDVDEPEEVGNISQDKWAPMAIAKTSGKRGRPAKSTPGRKKKKPNVSDNIDEKEIPPKKERGSKAKPRPPAPIPSSSRGGGRTTQVLKVKPEEDLENDDDLEDEEELNQGPNAKNAKKFTKGTFVVLKTDMIDEGNPPVWEINVLLNKYIPFKQDGKVVYKNTDRYIECNYSKIKYLYYSAPVSFISQTNKEHIIEFYKNKIKKDLKVEEAELADDDDEKE